MDYKFVPAKKLGSFYEISPGETYKFIFKGVGSSSKNYEKTFISIAYRGKENIRRGNPINIFVRGKMIEVYNLSIYLDDHYYEVQKLVRE